MTIHPAFDALKLVVSAGLHHASPGDNDDSIHMPHGCQPMRDDERGPSPHQNFERFLNEPLALRIERAGGFIQDEDDGILQDGPGNGDALTLAAGELDAAVADQGGVAFRERYDEVVRVGLARGLFDLLRRRVRFSVGDVLRDAAAKQQHFLRHHGHLAAKFRR